MLLAAANAMAQQSVCNTGFVFEDRDGDAMRDAGEPGLPDIAVSNGRDIVRSDAQGRYRLEADAGGFVFVIKPAGFSIHGRDDGMPDHWRADGLPAACDFALQREQPPPLRDKGLRVLVFGDPQPKSATDVGHYARGIVDRVIDDASAKMHSFRLTWAGQTADLGLTLGDVVNDDPSLYPAMKRETARLRAPWLHAPGNHDIDMESGDDVHALASFHGAFGPDTFAWQEPEANFVMLDDVIWQPTSSPRYIGGLREDQFTFLANYLRDARKDRLLVLSMHIPLFEPAGRDTFRDGDRARLFALLKNFPQVLLLTAHNHTQQHVFHGPETGWHGAQPLHEYNVGATCGAFWSGVKDEAGVPVSTMADGTPKGWARLLVQGDGRYALSYHPASDPAIGLHLHAPKVLRRGTYPAWGVYANVYMGDDDSVVEYRVDGGEWRPMRKVTEPDPDLLAENYRDDQADELRGFDRSPEAIPSAHLWRGALPTDLALGQHQVEVRAMLRGDVTQSATIGYRLDDAQP
ncbi:MAG: calcineurin-like phosphoesterase family protein [Xanthomonadaceae bacterium]|nr:calcineurin-like phosphoesterase family protein [Xanthomonadaceae bacterium]